MNGSIYSPIDAINKRIKQINSLYHAAATKAGISDGEMAVWSVLLSSQEKYSQQDLSELLFLSKQTVNSIVSNLVKKGFVVLEHVLGARNKKVVCLTEKGLAYGQESVLWIIQAERQAVEQTDIQELQALVSMLEKYAAQLKREFGKK